MTASLSDLARQFRFNEKTIAMVVEGFDEADWSRPPGDAGGNNAHWIVGHLAHSRRYVLRKLGAEIPDAEWEEAFSMGAKPDDTSSYPAPSDLLGDLQTSGELLATHLAELTDEAAAADWGGEFPDGANTIEGGARFFFFHESYHVGQLGLLRRIAGKPRFA